jgi:hypothetical protein
MKRAAVPEEVGSGVTVSSGLRFVPEQRAR